MKLALAAAVVGLFCAPAFAHRLDEYLQGALISVQKDRVEVEMTLTPGVAVLPAVLALIDKDANGVISEEEQRAYAEAVLRDLSLRIDGNRLTPHLLSVRVSTIEMMREGLGEIQINFSANLPRDGRIRKLVLENHHQGAIAAYQVNCLVSRDPDIRIEAQERNNSQSFYQLDYVQADFRSDLSSIALWSGRIGWLLAIPLILMVRLFLLWRRRAAAVGYSI